MSALLGVDIHAAVLYNRLNFNCDCFAEKPNTSVANLCLAYDAIQGNCFEKLLWLSSFRSGSQKMLEPKSSKLSFAQKEMLFTALALVLKIFEAEKLHIMLP